MGRFQDKKVLVTGAGRGFGRSLALAFAAEGADVVVHYNSSSAGAEATADEIRALGRKAITVKGNIASHAEVLAITEAAYGAFGRIDVLINNVGDMALDQKSWREMDEKVVDHTLAVDIKGTMFMIHEVGLRMVDGDGAGGSIVNIGSQVVVAGSPRAPQYAAAKYGVIGLTKSYARALAPKVRVNTLGAAFMETEALKNRFDWKNGRREEVLAQTPLARIASPEDMVGPVLFLAGDESRHMTGQFMLCNGGLAMVGA
ncbi:SDR family oxidoreductase [Siculibacillus lacustris]|uniref:SDR family oxidoreductase n=1 Tax=Siculibacillus lacustris TaxID=1549641 RepID=A0A4Q9VWH8_9HYPH|nr:SDR family oxidoreductase [Siculibacillus lacustris]TBW40672.1 SDR family oxidoreductase [Siculibacillus lacustris]